MSNQRNFKQCRVICKLPRCNFLSWKFTCCFGLWVTDFVFLARMKGPVTDSSRGWEAISECRNDSHHLKTYTWFDTIDVLRHMVWSWKAILNLLAPKLLQSLHVLAEWMSTTDSYSNKTNFLKPVAKTYQKQLPKRFNTYCGNIFSHAWWLQY